jgi:hypothetical protein
MLSGNNSSARRQQRVRTPYLNLCISKVQSDNMVSKWSRSADVSAPLNDSVNPSTHMIERALWIRRLEFAAALLFGMIIVLLMPLNRMAEGKNDFVHFYIGGLLYGTPDIHSQEVNYARQREIIGATLDHSFFGRPTFYGFFLKPLTLLPYRSAYALFQLLSLAAFLAFLRLNRGNLPLIPLTMVSVPLIANFVNGQDVTLILLFCSVALALAARGKDFAAGLVLTLCAIKLHFFIFVPLVVLIQKRWRIVAGGFAGGIVLMSLSLAGGGIELQRRLLEEMRKPEHSPYPGSMPNLRSLTGDDRVWFILLAVCVTACVVYLVSKSESLPQATGWALIGGLLISVHAYAQDCLLVLFAFALLHETVGPKIRALFYTAVLPFIYLALLCGEPYSRIFPLLILVILIAQVFATGSRLTQMASATTSGCPRAVNRLRCSD